MINQAASDLDDGEHATNLEKLTLTIMIGHGNTSSSRNVSRGDWTYLTSRGGVQHGSVIQRRPHDNSISRSRPLTRHNHKGWRSGDSSPSSGYRQGLPRCTGAVTTGGRGWPDSTPEGQSGRQCRTTRTPQTRGVPTTGIVNVLFSNSSRTSMGKILWQLWSTSRASDNST